MDLPASSQNMSSSKPTYACIRCSDRKVKCDRQIPCNSCVRHKVQCIFRPRSLSRRKQKVLRDALMEERLRRYESLLQENGIDPNRVIDSSEAETVWQLPSPASIVSGPQETLFKPRLLHGQRGTELLDNSLWSRVAEEIQDAGDAPEEILASDASDEGASNDDFSYVLGGKTPTVASSHPTPDIIHQLWQTFIENVNPLSKLVHVPSLQPAIGKVATNVERIPKGFEALMFAIYSMAVLSLTEDECKEMLGETRVKLLSRYVAATKTALSRAKFMSSTSIVVLQALVLHILSIRDAEDPRAVWSLTGVAFRIAEGMGVHVDGTLLSLSPFETEIRRRIWWQLNMHNFRAAELCGQPKFRDFKLDETSPKQPANVSDRDLYPAMPQAPAESTKPTEMIWCLFRSDMTIFATTQNVKIQKQGKAVLATDEYIAMDDLKIKDDFIQKMEDMVETKYLRFCDPCQPIQFMTLLTARLATNLTRFLAHHPRRWAKMDHVPASEQQLVWGIAFQLLEQYDMMQSNPQLRRFAWNVPYFIQWQAVIHVLDTLRADPLHPDAVKAWRLIDNLYEKNSEILLGLSRPIFVAVGNICLKAFSSRAAALTRENKNRFGPPEYITKLWKQREAVKLRRQAIIARSKELENLDDKVRSTTTDADVKWPDTPRSTEALGVAQPQGHLAANQAGYTVQESLQAGDDAFWLSDSLDEGFRAGGVADMMNLDTDAILSQEDHWLDNASGQAIDWPQWEAWFGSLDPAHPMPSAGAG